jgi:arylsulfatase A-like enzyme
VKRAAKRLGLAGAALALVLASGCAPDLPESLDLYAAVKSGHLHGLSFPRPPEAVEKVVDGERRPVVLTAMAPWTWHGRVPEAGRLSAGVQALPEAWTVIRGLRAVVAVREGRTREILDVASTAERRNVRWLDLEVDLSRYAGREVTLELSATLDGVPAKYRNANLVAWSPVLLAGPERQERPNLLVIVVDTLRHDHLTPYGYRVHDTSPEIQKWLADPGTVVEEAYSQAPWTLPSVVSFLTGRHPGELLGSDLASYGIPPGVPTLAEQLARLGYDTGGFMANPVLHEAAGFGRGFHTFWVDDVAHHAEDLNRHAVPWLRAHQRRPFFFYAQYVDPHDPYENPDMVNGRAFFMPDYTGRVAGDWIHGIYDGKIQLEDPERDVPYIRALYDGEVRYVDRHIGALLSQIDPGVLKDTLIVLTADHGEELDDHGGWKHGHTLYEDQIHVPLIVRWDGHVPAGKRLPGTVRLLDLLPTLVGVAGGGKTGKPDPAWDGVDLLPALTGTGQLPRRAAFAEGLSSGPLRAAAVLDGRKLILFNREEPYQPADLMQEYLGKKDMGRLQRAELYDLKQDSAERRNLAATDLQEVGSLASVIHGQLVQELPGLWMLPEPLPVGGRLSGSITFEHPPRGWSPYFLGPEDRVELAGSGLRFELTGAPGGKGLLIEGAVGRVVAAEVSLDGRPLPPAMVQRWMRSGAAKRQATANSETEKRLRNLGYIR